MNLQYATKITAIVCLVPVLLGLCSCAAWAQGSNGTVGYADPVTGNAWHFYHVALKYTKPDFVLNEIKQAYRPRTGGNDGLASLTKGSSNYGITSSAPGLGEIIPNRRDNSLLLFVTADGYENCKVMIRALDIPALISKSPTPLKLTPVPTKTRRSSRKRR